MLKLLNFIGEHMGNIASLINRLISNCDRLILYRRHAVRKQREPVADLLHIVAIDPF